MLIYMYNELFIFTFEIETVFIENASRNFWIKVFIREFD